MSTEDTIDKIVDHLNSELKASLKDYEFITKLNQTATESFKDYLIVADKIAKNVNRINENQKARSRLESLTQAIDEIDEKVTSLEALAYKIDSYSKRLEENFEKLRPVSS